LDIFAGPLTARSPPSHRVDSSMASEQPRRRKPVSEEKRERDVFLLYGAAFRDLPHLDSLGPNSETCSLPGEHVPRVSTDSTLTALAQLATFKLGAGRAMISLIDGERQYILAEATPNTSLRPGAPDAPSTLWLGSISIPRTWGMCEKVLNIDLQAFQAQEYPALVVKDLKESVEHANRSYIKESSVRFYASAPLRSPTGSIVGSVCVLDDVPRPDGLSQLHRESLRDIAESTMDYLHAYTVKDQYQRGEQFTRGLISFSEGASSLLPFENVTQHDPEASVSINPGLTSRGSISQHAKPSDPVNPEEEMTPRKKSATVRIKGRRQRSTQSLQESILPVDSRTMFARAANVMMASSNLDGVVILDASVAANRHEQHKNSDRRSGTETGTGTEDAGSSYQSRTSSSDEGAAQRGERVSGRSKACQVLGSAITKGIPFGDPSTEATFGPLLETDLARMLHDFPHGKILTFGINGLPVSSSDEGSSSAASDGNNSAPPRRRTTETQKYRISKAIIDMIPGVRSVAFIPFWDYERSRWFAGCVCWSLSPVRLLSASVDLAYFKVFSHSIMRELSRLDALALNQAKTTFVASISHELRSPLHGILGTLEFIKDTPLDAFQISMLNSLNACGQTLLDTINHVMDYAKISEGMRSVSSRRLKSTHTVRLSSRPHKSRRPKAGGFDLGIATEEVIEAVFSGSSYVPVSGAVMDAGSTASGSEAEPTITAKRKSCFIVLDIAQQDNWVYSFPIGSWRRIVMNIFGNAIKYTETGHIHVSLRVHDGSRVTGAPTAVVLTVTDSGLGMSPQYLANKAFQPFSQENSVCCFAMQTTYRIIADLLPALVRCWHGSG
jgi:signal transduction histidine kinase